MKQTKRKAFNFLRSYFDVLNELKEDSDKLSFLMSIINKQFLNEDPKGLDFIAKLCYESQRHSIESSVKGWIRANKTNLQGALLDTPTTNPPTDPTTNPKEEEEEEKEQVEEKEEEKVKVIIDREAEFKNSLQPFLEEFGKEVLNNFYLYWTEKKPKGRKMLFEMQKTFDIKRRLDRWDKNNFKSKEKRLAEHNSCRWCSKPGKTRIEDTEKNEFFNLCDFHLGEYNIDTDKIKVVKNGKS